MTRLQTAVLALSILSYLASAKPIHTDHPQDKAINSKDYYSSELELVGNQFQLDPRSESAINDDHSVKPSKCTAKDGKHLKNLNPTNVPEPLHPTKSASFGEATSTTTLVTTSTCGTAIHPTRKATAIPKTTAVTVTTTADNYYATDKTSAYTTTGTTIASIVDGDTSTPITTNNDAPGATPTD